MSNKYIKKKCSICSKFLMVVNRMFKDKKGEYICIECRDKKKVE